MKNEQKVAVAQQVLDHAKSLGFEDAYLTYCDEEGTLYESVEDVAKETLAGEVTIAVHLILDEELSLLVEEGEEDSDDPPRTTFVS
jgi:hypothetical protein